MIAASAKLAAMPIHAFRWPPERQIHDIFLLVYRRQVRDFQFWGVDSERFGDG
jgi:hypothetical protein